MAISCIRLDGRKTGSRDYNGPAGPADRRASRVVSNYMQATTGYVEARTHSTLVNSMRSTWSLQIVRVARVTIRGIKGHQPESSDSGCPGASGVHRHRVE